MHTRWRRHVWLNRVQTLLLMALLFGLMAGVGGLLLGETGVWMMLAAGVVG